MQLCEDKNNFANIVILKYFYGNLTILPPNDTFINKKKECRTLACTPVLRYTYNQSFQPRAEAPSTAASAPGSDDFNTFTLSFHKNTTLSFMCLRIG